MKAVIHATRLKWQDRYFEFFKQGFSRHGITTERFCFDRAQPGDIHVLFGPNYWKNCEKIYDNYLFVNRKFIGNVDDDVAISWNGFNGRGIFNVNSIDPQRLEVALERSPIKIHPWRRYNPDSFLLLGQADTGRCLLENLNTWYQDMRLAYKGSKPVFRKWPRGDGHTLIQDIARTGFSVSLNSTVAVETLMMGHPTVVFDKGSPVWSICNMWNNPGIEPKRIALFEYLANCQYHYSEISTGDFWCQLGEGPVGPRLHDVEF